MEWVNFISPIKFIMKGLLMRGNQQALIACLFILMGHIKEET